MIILAAALAIFQSTGTACVPIGRTNDQGWMKRHEAICAAAKQVQPQLVMLGDSITHCWGGPPDTGENFGKRGQKPWDEYLLQYKPVNMGISGDRTNQVLWRIEHGCLDDIHPRCLFLMIGTNNLGDTSALETVRGIRTVIKAIRKKLPLTVVVVESLLPRQELLTEPSNKVQAVNAVLPKVAREEGCLFVDLDPVFAEADGHYKRDLYIDPVHPNPAGYEAWGKFMKNLLPELFKDP